MKVYVVVIIKIGIAIEKNKMTLGHEKLDSYRLSIGYCVKEDSAVYGFDEIDFDPDPDSDLDHEETKADVLDAYSSRQ